jgi:ubiquinone/menaquinone biosynthesis C-methylase UbiE
MADDHRYFATDAAFADEDARLRLIEQGTDEGTIRCLIRLGIARGWRCLEIGAGAGSIAAWLGEQVGPDGYVLATDIDTRHLQWIDAPNVVVRTHDIVMDPLERDSYDLAHCRAVLEHLGDPDQALGQMVRSLRCGGSVLVEGADFSRFASVDKQHPLASTFDSAMQKVLSFIASTGTFDPYFGLTLAERLAASGVEDISTEDVGQTLNGGMPMAVMLAMSWRRFDPALKERDILTDDEVSARDEALHDDSFTFQYGGIAAWGRRP